MEEQVKARFRSGRLDIPLEMQRRLDLHEGGCLSLRVEDGRLIGEAVEAAPSEERLRTLKDLSILRDRIADGPSLSDALSAYRQQDSLDDRKPWRS